MRYMMLIYSREGAELSAEDAARIYAAHASVMRDATAKGVLVGAEPLALTSSATTIRMCQGKMLATDGPFAETKEQLAGITSSIAARIPTSCYGDEGSIEIGPLRSVSNHA